MATITIPYVFTPNTTILSTQVNANFSTIQTLVNGQIDNSNISTTANIALSKLGLNPGQAAFNKTTTGNQTWASGLTTDTQPQVAMFSDKGLQFGPGGAVGLDVKLQRSALNTLELSTPGGGAALLDMNLGTIFNLRTMTFDSAAGVLNMNGGSIIGVGSLSGPNPANAGINGLRASSSSTLAIAPNGSAITSISVLPYLSSFMGLWNGTGWTLSDLGAGLSVAVPATTNTSYDLAVDYNSGTPQAVVFQWVAANTPPAGRGVQNGVPYTNGNARYRLIAVFQTGAVSGQINDNPGERGLVNIYNTVPRSLAAQIPVASWTYNVNTLRASNANTTNGQGRVAFILPFANMSVDAVFTQPYSQSSAAAASVNHAQNAIGLDSTTAATSAICSTSSSVSGATEQPGGVNVATASLSNLTAGQHYLQMLEAADATPRTWTFYGNGTPGHSLTGTIMA